MGDVLFLANKSWDAITYPKGREEIKMKTKKITLAAMLIALGVACSGLSIPVGAARCFPVQHMVNVLAAVVLGPFWGIAMAFITSVLRVMLGTGTLLAFPGSMCGALLCGIVYHKSKRVSLTYLAEIVGTAVLGGFLAYPVAVLFMGKEAALWTYIVPFAVSTCGGTVLAALVVGTLQKTNIFSQYLETNRS